MPSRRSGADADAGPVGHVTGITGTPGTPWKAKVMLITADRLKHMTEAQIATAIDRYDVLIEAMIEANDRLWMKLDAKLEAGNALQAMLGKWWDAYHELVEQVRLVKLSNLAELDTPAIANGIACYETLVEVMIINNNDLLTGWHQHPEATNEQIDILNSWSMFHNGLCRAHRLEIEKTGARPN